MSIFDIFKSNEKRVKLSHIRNLIAVALADGKLEKSELAAISSICNREGISVEEVKKCLNNPKSIKFVPPTNDEQRLNYLRDMVIVMMCDGNIDDNEVVVCKITAEALGFKHEVIEALVLNIINEIKSNLR